MADNKTETQKIEKPDAQWKKELNPMQYWILRQKGTEPPFSGKYWNTKDDGTYICAACGNPLFVSDTKFDSGCGWPSFDQAIEGSTQRHEDVTLGMRRVEVTCARCDSHLGHVFPDGPRETTGERFCINSACIDLKK